MNNWGGCGREATLPPVPIPRTLSFLEERDEKYDSRASKWHRTRLRWVRKSERRKEEQGGEGRLINAICLLGQLAPVTICKRYKCESPE